MTKDYTEAIIFFEGIRDKRIAMLAKAKPFENVQTNSILDDMAHRAMIERLETMIPLLERYIAMMREYMQAGDPILYDEIEHGKIGTQVMEATFGHVLPRGEEANAAFKKVAALKSQSCGLV